MYVLDCLNAFFALVRALTGDVVREVKNEFVGREEWKARAGTDLIVDLEARARVLGSWNGRRIANAIFKGIL